MYFVGRKMRRGFPSGSPTPLIEGDLRTEVLRFSEGGTLALTFDYKPDGWASVCVLRSDHALWFGLKYWRYSGSLQGGPALAVPYTRGHGCLILRGVVKAFLMTAGVIASKATRL